MYKPKIKPDASKKTCIVLDKKQNSQITCSSTGCIFPACMITHQRWLRVKSVAAASFTCSDTGCKHLQEQFLLWVFAVCLSVHLCCERLAGSVGLFPVSLCIWLCCVESTCHIDEDPYLICLRVFSRRQLHFLSCLKISLPLIWKTSSLLQNWRPDSAKTPSNEIRSPDASY